jgi:energy-converting hydrogenase A subunit M
MSLKGSQKNLKEKITLNEGGMKRIVENTLEEQQPMVEGGVKRIAENTLEEQQPMKEWGVKRISESTLEEQQPMKEGGVKGIAENTLEEQHPMKEGGVKRIAENILEEQQPMKEGGVKRRAENAVKEQQPMKVIITEKENIGETVNEKHEQSESRQVSFKKADAGNKPIQKCIVKQKIVQGDGKEIKINSESLEHIKETIEAITAKYPWNKTLIDTGDGSEVDEQGTKTQQKTFVVVKDDSRRGKGNQKTIGGYRIDVVTNYVLSQSQVKQLLGCDWDKK